MPERPNESIRSSLTGDIPPIEADGARVYRLRRGFLWLGVGATLFFASVGVASVVAAWWNLDGSFPAPRAIAIGLGIGWGGFTLLGSYLILCYCRERLFVGEQAVLKQGCFGRRLLRFGEVTSAEWRTGPAGPSASGPSLILRDPVSKIVIRLYQWGNVDDRRELIEHFRRSIDAEVQQGWETFESRILLDPSGLMEWAFEAWVGMIFLIFAGGSVVGWLVDPARHGNLTVAAVSLVIGGASMAHAWQRKIRAARKTPGA